MDRQAIWGAVLSLALLVLALAGCSGASGPQPTPSIMGQIWQPPEPKKQVARAITTEIPAPQDVILTYEISGLAGSEDLYVEQDGEVVSSGLPAPYYYTLQLTQAEWDNLKEQIDGVSSKSLATIEAEPTAIPTTDAPVATISFMQAGGGQTILVPPPEQEPETLNRLIDTLDQLKMHARQQAMATKPGLFVGYSLWNGTTSWAFDIDESGGLYYNNDYHTDGGADGHLSEGDMETLRRQLEAVNMLAERDAPNGYIRYSAPDSVQQAISGFEHNAVVQLYEYADTTMEAASGATVPKELGEILQELAEIYDKYAPQ